MPVSYTHLRAHETSLHLVCRLLLEKKNFLIIRRPPRSTHCISSAASDVYKRQLYFGGVDAKYFNVGKVERDQIEDYAKRKGITVEVAEKWLAPNLAYS